MSRRDEFKQVSKNPSKKFLEWKSDNKNFSYYDKDKGANVTVGLPFKFLVLKEMHTVKGWHDASESGIYANEVENIGKDKITVKAFKGGVIASGIYKDIKEVVSSQGANYSKSIYCMDDSGSIINIQFKGACVQAWGDFTQKGRVRLSDEWVIIEAAEDKKKGKVNYSVPIFKYESPISKEDDNKADASYSQLKEYFSEYLNDTPEVESHPKENEQEKQILNLNTPLFDKIKSRIESDPSLSIDAIAAHYNMSEEVREELMSILDLPF